MSDVTVGMLNVVWIKSRSESRFSIGNAKKLWRNPECNHKSLHKYLSIFIRKINTTIYLLLITSKNTYLFVIYLFLLMNLFKIYT